MKLTIILFLALAFGSNISAQVDHSEFIEGPFDSPQAVTSLCLECHEGIDKDIMMTRHWNWLGEEFVNSEGKTIRLGKQNIINNFCIALPSNWPRCTSCHIGYGWEDENFDFTDGNNIDCLICHEQTGTYKKVPTGAGMPDPSVDLLKSAQSVGRTKIENCSICHFNGGGGTGIKHGDMDASMINPSPELDVHMGLLEFTCSDCHAGENHAILGAGQASMAAGENHISCNNCHDEKPHISESLNNHSSSVACETCHIPTFARHEATKTWWDWSTAGSDKSVEIDELGMPMYAKKKGDFTWNKEIVPEYRWHNGQADYYLHGDIIDPDEIVVLNTLSGSYGDPSSKITPFKVMRGKQIYDTKNNYLIIPKLFGDDGYWASFDWNAAAKLGMQSIQLAYSGKYGFIETEMYWPINHMVAPAENALTCTDCHSSTGLELMNWEALGYKGDPAESGGRLK